jgi:hypothetical protein
MRYLKSKKKKNFCIASPFFFVEKYTQSKNNKEHAFERIRLRYQSLKLACKIKTNLSS